MRETHNITLSRQIIENNIRILNRCPDRLLLAIAEALLIRERAPRIWLQDNTFARNVK